MPTLPPPADLARHWTLDPEVAYLNHGSFGACPRAVLEAQSDFRARLEREPVRFFIESFDDLMDEARAATAAFVKCPAEDLVFVPNATQAIATVILNIEPTLKPGDELLATAHEYPACLNNLRRTAARTGAKVVIVPIPFPLTSPDQITQAILAAVTPRTRLALISQVTSPSGLILPVEQMIAPLESRGVQTIIDGAHAPGFTPRADIAALNPSFYTANCHKWLCAPKGSGLLYIRRDRQHDFHPWCLSYFAEKPKPGRKHLLTEFDYIGTMDQTAWLSIPAAIKTVQSLVPGGWPEVMRRNHELTIKARNLLCRALDVHAPAPDSMLGSLSAIFLPAHDEARTKRLLSRPSRYHDALQDILVSKHRIQVPLWSIAGDGRRLFRISAQLYNSLPQYEYLAAALTQELAAERTL